jgi:hypothetical protein
MKTYWPRLNEFGLMYEEESFEHNWGPFLPDYHMRPWQYFCRDQEIDRRSESEKEQWWVWRQELKGWRAEARERWWKAERARERKEERQRKQAEEDAKAAAMGIKWSRGKIRRA